MTYGVTTSAAVSAVTQPPHYSAAASRTDSEATTLFPRVDQPSADEASGIAARKATKRKFEEVLLVPTDRPPSGSHPSTSILENRENNHEKYSQMTNAEYASTFSYDDPLGSNIEVILGTGDSIWAELPSIYSACHRYCYLLISASENRINAAMHTAMNEINLDSHKGEVDDFLEEFGDKKYKKLLFVRDHELYSHLVENGIRLGNNSDVYVCFFNENPVTASDYDIQCDARHNKYVILDSSDKSIIKEGRIFHD
ncbi:hypothetical protein [Endozoicomonas sp. 8E]|uniref:hypothetical protein n=1 Tax=Endozoicomonas sp. 8E TaxID=3035692 RepID=UPI002938DC65|nr:hypothetical protein [Endozoicomonas sp. 8E]WOG27297.1 hypothetical protein P6910_22545 [Endozoicomonas sp. 8E]